MKSHCPKGHAYSADNTYTDSRGHHHCRTCGRERTKNWYENKARQNLKESRASAHANFVPPEPLPPDTKWKEFGHWLAGFVDGEGCFAASSSGNKIQIQFMIQLRADDKPILEEIQRMFGTGKLYFRPPSAFKINAKPTWTLVVKKIQDLHQIVCPVFDAFPLRAKKSKDYHTWRQIVQIAAAHKKGRGTLMTKIGEKVSPLIAELKKNRNYM